MDDLQYMKQNAEQINCRNTEYQNSEYQLNIYREYPYTYTTYMSEYPLTTFYYVVFVQLSHVVKCKKNKTTKIKL